MEGLGRTALIAMVARACALVLGLLCTILLPRVLPATELATYWIVLSALGFVVLLTQTGVGQVTISQAAQSIALGDRAKARALICNALVVVLLAGSAVGGVAAILFGSGWLGGPDPQVSAPSALFMAAGGALCPLALQLVDSLRTQQRMTAASWMSAQPTTGGVVPSAVLLAMLTCQTLYGAPLTLRDVLLWVLAGWGAMTIIAASRLAHPPDLAPRLGAVSPRVMQGLVRASAPMLAASLAMFVITQADLWFMYRWRDASETATYGIAANFVKYVSAINVMLGALLPSLVAQLWAQQERARLEQLLVRTARAGAMAAALVVLALVSFGQPLLALAVGQNHAAAWLPLVVLSVGHLVNALLGYSQIVLVTAGHTRPLLLAALLACASTVVALALATPHWGMVGAATAAAGGVVLYNVITCFACASLTGIHCHALARQSRLSKNETHP